MDKNKDNIFHEVIELHGHIIDSLTLSKLFDEIIARGGAYVSEEISIGTTKDDPSYARIRVEARKKSVLDNILVRLSELGATMIENKEVLLKKSPKDGVFPDGFYSTTNLETEIFSIGEWIAVADISMDSAILVDVAAAKTAMPRAIKMKDVKKGEQIVVGFAGVRVQVPERPAGSGTFEFMTSGVSSEKPMIALISSVADEIRALRKEDNQAKILFVCGPAIVHTGARDDLSCLIEKGYVDVLFAGNALAAHDIEASIYGTSLGVSLA